EVVLVSAPGRQPLIGEGLMAKHTLPLVACVVILAGGLARSGLYVTCAEDPAGSDLKPILRRPVALALADDGKWLFVANQRGGTISVIDTVPKTVAWVRVGGKLADLVATP